MRVVPPTAKWCDNVETNLTTYECGPKNCPTKNHLRQTTQVGDFLRLLTTPSCTLTTSTCVCTCPRDFRDFRLRRTSSDFCANFDDFLPRRYPTRRTSASTTNCRRASARRAGRLLPRKTERGLRMKRGPTVSERATDDGTNERTTKFESGRRKNTRPKRDQHVQRRVR